MNGRPRSEQGVDILNIMLCLSALPMHLLFSNTYEWHLSWIPKWFCGILLW
jgi:hypothetical protein